MHPRRSRSLRAIHQGDDPHQVDPDSNRFSDGDRDGEGMITDDELDEEIDRGAKLERLVKGWIVK